MKIRVDKRKVKGKEYDLYRATLTKREYLRLKDLGSEFEIQDVDPKGFVALKVTTKVSATSLVDPKTSFNVYDGRVLERFKVLCRGRGLSMCQVLNDFMSGVVNGEERGVKIVNVFFGVPRSRKKEVAWSSRFLHDKVVESVVNG